MLTAYMWASGPEFDAKRFAQEHDGEGSLRQTQVMQGTRALPGPAEWESRRVEVPDNVPADKVIQALLERYGTLIADAKRVGATEIYVQFVGRKVDPDANGFHLSPKLMRTLADRGISVDYDIVRTAQAA
jgi:hypothetical protein